MMEVNEDGVVAKDCFVSKDAHHLYQSAAPQNLNEATTALFHVIVLESGFIPQDIQEGDKFKFMPKEWNSKGLFKINYVHSCCPSFSCCMTCVPLYNTISVHGSICGADSSESVDLKINLNDYLKQKDDFSDLLNVFYNLEKLSVHFKDNFCLPLLNLLHETVGINRLFGFLGLYDELKVYILQLLPVKSVVSMSAVNKNLHELANSSLLWKHLFLRDFSKDSIPDDSSSSSENNWKKMYKSEYAKKKRPPEHRHYMFPHFRIPQFFDVGPDFDTDIGIHFDPPFVDPPGIFGPPFSPSRFPPYFRQLF